MDHISTLLQRVLRTKGYKSEADASLIVHDAQEWIRIHLPEVKKDIRVRKFQDRILTIETDDSMVAQEVHALSQDLTAYLNAKNAPALQCEQIRIIRKK